MHRILNEHNLLQDRRQFLKTSGMGLGVTALAALLPQNRAARVAPHHAPRAKRVIFLFMAGAPSQIDLFDYKPNLERLFKEPLPESISMGQRVTAMTKGHEQIIAPSMFKFRRRGQNGVWWSELFPYLSTVADANPRHPFGLRGVGEVPIVPPLAALSNAIYHAVGVRLTKLPMNPGSILEALEAKKEGK